MNPMHESNMVAEPLVDDRSRAAGVATLDPPHVEPAVAHKSILGRVVKAFMLSVVLFGGAIFGLYKMRLDIPALSTSKLYTHIDSLVGQAEHLKGYIAGKYEAQFQKHEGEAHHEEHKIVLTSPMAQDVTITQAYVCQIHSQRHINICALQDGYLKAIPIREGQSVKAGDVMFEILSTLYKARLDAELAERDLAQLEFNNTKRLAGRGGVSENEVKLFEAKLGKAQARADLALAEFNFCTIRAPFDGIVDRLLMQQGTLVKEGDVLTTLSDNSVMWVYFNVPEKRYLEYKAETAQNKESPDIELKLANHSKFTHMGKIDPAHNIGAIEANFNNETGNIAFRADFPNPEGLLRHGQTGTVLINRPLKGAMVIPQRTTFENLAKQYVYIVDKDDVVHQREIRIDYELEDAFVIEPGILDVKDKLILEGIRQVRDGQKVESEFRDPKEVMEHAKNPAQ